MCGGGGLSGSGGGVHKNVVHALSVYVIKRRKKKKQRGGGRKTWGVYSSVSQIQNLVGFFGCMVHDSLSELI